MKKSPERRICSINKCKKEAKSGRLCYAHRKRVWIDRNPEKYVYNNLKTNAKRRGKEFDIGFDEFVEFCHKTSYMVGRGKSKTSFHIDRKDETKGYTIDNIQVLTNFQNVKKYIRWYWDGGKMVFSTTTTKETDLGDVPF